MPCSLLSFILYVLNKESKDKIYSQVLQGKVLKLDKAFPNTPGSFYELHKVSSRVGKL